MLGPVRSLRPPHPIRPSTARLVPAALARAWPAPAPRAGLMGPLSPSGTCKRSQHGECDQKSVQQGRGAATYTQCRPPVPGRSSGPMTAPRLVANSRAKPPINRMEIMSVPQL